MESNSNRGLFLKPAVTDYIEKTRLKVSTTIPPWGSETYCLAEARIVWDQVSVSGFLHLILPKTKNLCERDINLDNNLQYHVSFPNICVYRKSCYTQHLFLVTSLASVSIYQSGASTAVEQWGITFRGSQRNSGLLANSQWHHRLPPEQLFLCYSMLHTEQQLSVSSGLQLIISTRPRCEARG